MPTPGMTILRRQNTFARKLYRPFGWLVAMLLLVGGTPSDGQIGASFAQVSGIVYDPTGGRVLGATATLVARESNQVYSTHANSNGFYVFSNVTPGGYEITVESPGFAAYTQAGIVLRVGQIATIDVNLRIDSHSERVVVTGELPVVEPGRTEVSQLIDARQITSLPISGRLFTDFVLLSPGVASGRTSLQSTITEF